MPVVQKCMITHYMDEVVYQNSPVHYLANMPSDHPFVEKYNRGKGIICVGGGEPEHYDLLGEKELRPIVNVEPD